MATSYLLVFIHNSCVTEFMITCKDFPPLAVKDWF